MTAEQAVKEANDARAAFKDLNAGYLRSRQERSVASRVFDERWKTWVEDTANTPESNEAMRKAWAEYERAMEINRSFDSDTRSKAREDWSAKVNVATALLQQEAGLLRDFDDEG